MAIPDNAPAYSLVEGERELLAATLGGDTVSLNKLFSRYAPPVFYYLLNLSGCGRDAAYEKTSEVLAETLSSRSKESGEWFLTECLREALDAARRLPPLATFDIAHEQNALSPERAASRQLLKEALGQLTFDDKAFLLLRDQLCLPFSLIGRVHGGLPERDARVRVERARLALRDSLEKILKNREGAV